MILDLALALALLALMGGAALWWASEQRRRARGLPRGRAIYQDRSTGREPVLQARTLPLRGRPDLLLRQGDVIIPIEVKTGPHPARAPPGARLPAPGILPAGGGVASGIRRGLVGTAAL